MRDKVTIVIPVYNTEPKLLERCFLSVAEQSYSNLEIIVVDDGSTDKNTWRCIKKYEDKYNISVIRTKNLGVSHARNVGIEHAVGKYVIFLDSDDYLDGGFVEVMLDNIRDKKVVACFTGKIEINERSSKNTELLDGKILTKKEIDYIVKNIQSSQGAIMLASAIKKIKFNEEIKYAEDALFVSDLIRKGNFYCTKSDGYYYVQHQESSIHRITLEKAISTMKDIERVYIKIAAENPEDRNGIYGLAIEKMNVVLTRLLSGRNSFKDYRFISKKIKSMPLLNENIAVYRKTKLQSMKNVLIIKKYFLLYWFLVKTTIVIKRFCDEK